MEALIAVKKAVEFLEKNRVDKARKLFRRALALAPDDRNVLSSYGEFLEREGDVVTADHFYFRAGDRREGTRAVVDRLDFKHLQRIEFKKNRLPDGRSLFRWCGDDGRARHVLRNVAVEGNGANLEQTKRVMETGSPVPGLSVVECGEILGVDSALRYLEILLSEKGGIGAREILEIHRRVMEPVDPRVAGKFRSIPVYVNGCATPPASKVGRLVDRLVKNLDGHPILVAAFAHLELASVHPFVDGNGRTARHRSYSLQNFPPPPH